MCDPWMLDAQAVTTEEYTLCSCDSRNPHSVLKVPNEYPVWWGSHRGQSPGFAHRYCLSVSLQSVLDIYKLREVGKTGERREERGRQTNGDSDKKKDKGGRQKEKERLRERNTWFSPMLWLHMTLIISWKLNLPSTGWDFRCVVTPGDTRMPRDGSSAYRCQSECITRSCQSVHRNSIYHHLQGLLLLQCQACYYSTLQNLKIIL